MVVLLPQFRMPAWRPFRAGMFVAMGLSAIFPVLHGIEMFGAAQMERQIGLSWLVTQGLLYILGAGIYAVSTRAMIGARKVDPHDSRDKLMAGLTGVTFVRRWLQARVPERWAPGSFDIWGSSHQIFHVLVVMAAGAHLMGLLKAFDHAHSARSSFGGGFVGFL